MDDQKLNALLQVSAYFDPQPEAVFRTVLEAVIGVYGDTMAMINLIEGDRIHFRAVANPHRLMRRAQSMLLQDSYCQFATGPGCPVLIQNAATDARHQGHPAVRFGLTRYLGVPIANPAGEPLGTLCFLDGHSEELLDQSDIEFLSLLAMRVSAELERERLIEARLRKERETAEQLRRAVEEKRRFTTSVIHDLRQPISTLRTLSHLLKTEDPTEQRDSLHLMDQCVDSLNAMAEELLEYTEIETGNIRWHLERVPLNDLISECVELFRARADGCHVRLRLALQPNLSEAEVDRTKIGHVIGNLVDNAVKHAAIAAELEPGRDAWVSVEANEDAGSWFVSISDSGLGIPAELQERIFEEFYQAPAGARSQVGGRGLGLAIVRHLCDAMQARLSVDSEPGSGTRFSVTFPRCPDAALERTVHAGTG